MVSNNLGFFAILSHDLMKIEAVLPNSFRMNIATTNFGKQSKNGGISKEFARRKVVYRQSAARKTFHSMRKL
jgi:hypothetical protein